MADGSYGTVDAAPKTIERSQPMYDLTVDTAHTFFVGDEQWLVHNNKCEKSFTAQDIINKREVGDTTGGEISPYTGRSYTLAVPADYSFVTHSGADVDSAEGGSLGGVDKVKQRGEELGHRWAKDWYEYTHAEQKAVVNSDANESYTSRELCNNCKGFMKKEAAKRRSKITLYGPNGYKKEFGS